MKLTRSKNVAVTALLASVGAAAALGTLALNRGDLPSALESISRAVQADPRRAPAHFLLALAHAKATRLRLTHSDQAGNVPVAGPRHRHSIYP